MSDWQEGDLALCVVGGFIAGLSLLKEYPRAGALYTVSGVNRAKKFQTGIQPALYFLDAPKNGCGHRVWSARRFIKVTPPPDMKLIEEKAALDQNIVQLRA